MNIQITITEDDVRNQERGDCARCAVARAINRYLEPALKVRAWVLDFYWRLEEEGSGNWRSQNIMLPDPTRGFIQVLDGGDVPSLPHVFETEIPTAYLAQEGVLSAL